MWLLHELIDAKQHLHNDPDFIAWQGDRDDKTPRNIVEEKHDRLKLLSLGDSANPFEVSTKIIKDLLE